MTANSLNSAVYCGFGIIIAFPFLATLTIRPPWKEKFPGKLNERCIYGENKLISQSQPLVTIGIPTYNRAALLRRAIESVLGQDYSMIEVIVSNNASSDNTQDICQEFSKKDGRAKYVTQSSNIGATLNFNEVLKRASGEYFMWLGDDDWIDASYISHCVSLLRADPDVALVAGAPIYYRDGKKDYEGKMFDLSEESWANRVARYYTEVTDNGMYYGIMRTAQLRQIVVPNALGGDWHLIANVVSMGKTRMCAAVTVCRDLNGASSSSRHIVKSLGLPAIQAMFPMTTVALGAVRSIVFTGSAYKKRSILARITLAGVVFLRVITKPTFRYTAKSE